MSLYSLWCCASDSRFMSLYSPWCCASDRFMSLYSSWFFRLIVDSCHYTTPGVVRLIVGSYHYTAHGVVRLIVVSSPYSPWSCASDSRFVTIQSLVLWVCSPRLIQLTDFHETRYEHYAIGKPLHLHKTSCNK